MSTRSWLLVAWFFGGCTTSASSEDMPPSGTTPCPTVATDRAVLLARAETFSVRHGVETTIAFDGCPANTFLSCDPVEPSQYTSIVTYMDQVDAEVDRYPAGFFTAINLDYFVFGSHLTKNNPEHDALGGATIPYGGNRSVLFIGTDVTKYCYAPVSQRVAHHEIAHAIDYGFAGATGGDWWTTMNPPGFAYGNVDFHALDILDITHPGPGLVTKYADYNVSEDYAEVFTAMFVPGKEADLRGFLDEDTSLRAKFRAVLGALATRWPAFVDAMPNRAAVP